MINLSHPTWKEPTKRKNKNPAEAGWYQRHRSPYLAARAMSAFNGMDGPTRNGIDVPEWKR